MRRFFLSLTALLVGGLFFPLTAFAYLPPGSYIVGKMAEKRAALQITDLDVRLQTTYGNNEPADNAENEERLCLKRGGKLRWQHSDDSETISILKDGVRHEWNAAGTVTSEKQAFEPLVDLLIPRAQSNDAVRGEFIMLCQRLGIDTSQVRLARFASRVAYVIGGGKDGANKPELWIDKDSLQPLRVIYRGNVAGQDHLLEVQFREFGSREGGDLLPRVIDLLNDGKVVSHSEIDRVSSNSKLSDNLFVAPAAKH